MLGLVTSITISMGSLSSVELDENGLLKIKDSPEVESQDGDLESLSSLDSSFDWRSDDNLIRESSVSSYRPSNDGTSTGSDLQEREDHPSDRNPVPEFSHSYPTSQRISSMSEVETLAGKLTNHLLDIIHNQAKSNQELQNTNRDLRQELRATKKHHRVYKAKVEAKRSERREKLAAAKQAYEEAAKAMTEEVSDGDINNDLVELVDDESVASWNLGGGEKGKCVLGDALVCYIFSSDS